MNTDYPPKQEIAAESGHSITKFTNDASKTLADDIYGPNSWNLGDFRKKEHLPDYDRFHNKSDEPKPYQSWGEGKVLPTDEAPKTAIPEIKDNMFCAPIKVPIEGGNGKTEEQYMLQTDVAGLQLKTAVDLSNAVLNNDDKKAKELLQKAMEKDELKNVLYLTNCFLGSEDSDQRLFAVDSVEKVTYTEDRGTHSPIPKSVEFENPRATVAVIDLDSGKVETIGTVKNDPYHKGYITKED